MLFSPSAGIELSALTPETFTDFSMSLVISWPTGMSAATTRTGSRESILTASNPARAAPPTISRTASAVSAGRRRLGGDGTEAKDEEALVRVFFLPREGPPLALLRAWSVVWDMRRCSVMSSAKRVGTATFRPRPCSSPERSGRNRL